MFSSERSFSSEVTPDSTSSDLRPAVATGGRGEGVTRKGWQGILDVVVGSYRQKALTVIHTKEHIRIEAVAHHATAALYGWVVRVGGTGGWRVEVIEDVP